MNDTVRRVFRIFLFISVVFLLTSCRAKESMSAEKVSFLWFIPVDALLTVVACSIEMLFFLVGFLWKFFYKEAGTFSEEIQRAIRDKDGNITGWYDTGEMRTWSVSKEEEDLSRERARRSGAICRIVPLVCISWGIFISWIFPIPGVLFWVFWVPVSFFRLRDVLLALREADYHLESFELIMLWEKIFVVICLICTIVYGPISGIS